MKSAKAFERAWAKREAHVLARDEYPLALVSADELGDHGLEIVEPLLARLDADDLRVVLLAALALERLARFADAIVPRIVPRFVDPHPWIADAMSWIVHELGAGALLPMQDAYATQPTHAHAIARTLARLGPHAANAAGVLRDDARTDPVIADALRAIEGPWDREPETAIPYLGEAVRLDGDGPSSRIHYGRELWLELLMDRARHDDERWHRANLDDVASIAWWPEQIAVAARTLTLAAYNSDRDATVTAEITADDGGARGFTNHELLHELLATHHAIAPCNDRIFEGLRREPDGSYYIHTGS